MSTTSNKSSTPCPTSSFNRKRFVFERYPKTSFEQLQSSHDSSPSSHDDCLATRSRSQQRFRTQPITLSEIHETDEDNKLDQDQQPQQQQTSSSHQTLDDFQRLEHLTFSENVRRGARKKAPLKNYLERQRLKAMREEPCENETN